MAQEEVVIDGNLSLDHTIDGDASLNARLDGIVEKVIGIKGDKGDKGDPGPKGDKGDPGDDYVLTAQDKADIAELVNVPVEDVQINGSSIVAGGLADIPVADGNIIGVVKGGNGGTGVIVSNGGTIYVVKATSAGVKGGLDEYRPIVPQRQHESAFYGLAKAAGDTTQANSSNAVGNYTDEAKTAIQTMLGIYEPQFRTIKEINITETTKTLYIDTDVNGNPFALKEVIVYFDKMIATGNGAAWITPNRNTRLSGDDALSAPVLAMNNGYYTTERNTMGHMWLSGGRFFGIGLDGLTNFYTQSNLRATRNACGFCECNQIESLFIYSANDHKFTSGTITIIGR